MWIGVLELISNIVLETYDFLLGICEGVFVIKQKLTYDPKTGKMRLSKS